MRTILILILLYYTARFLLKLFAPYLMKKAMHKMQEKTQQQYGNTQQQKKSTVKEGETVIDKAPQNPTKQSNNTVGEYVDFEEID